MANYGKYYIAGIVYDENFESVIGNYETSDFENFIFNEIYYSN